MDIELLTNVIEETDTYKRYGKVVRIVGLMIESVGPAANIGEVCLIHHERTLKNRFCVKSSASTMKKSF